MRQLKITKSITNRESASLEKYLQDIGRESLVNQETEVLLAKKIKQGDQKALEKLTKANLRFVVSVAKQYQNQGLSLPDLINEGNLGLIKAAKRFDETKGFKFISYAVWWIRQSILQALAEQGRIVRLPLNQLGVINKIKKEFSKLEQKFEREPTADELSELTKITSEKIRECERISGKHTSVDAMFSIDNKDITLLDTLASSEDSTDEKMMSESLSMEILRSLDTLPPKESAVLKLFYGIACKRAHTLEEIGEKFELTRERVRQIKEAGIRRLRNKSRSKLLKNYLC